MTKDPAFLLYSKDWLEGTAELSPEAKGVFIDLLCYQHQRKNLPKNEKKLAKLSSLSFRRFTKIWNDELSCKFISVDQVDNHVVDQVDNHMEERLINLKLQEVTQDRDLKAKKNRVVGVFATLIRTTDGLKYADKKKIKESFLVNDFISFSKEEMPGKVTEWFNHMVDQVVPNTRLADEDISISSYINDKEFVRVWKEEWIPFRKTNKWSTNNVFQERSLKKLVKISKGDPSTALKIVQESLDNGWQGLFALKMNGKPNHTKSRIGSRQGNGPGKEYKPNDMEI